MAYENLMVFTGNANPALAEGVAKNLGIAVGKAALPGARARQRWVGIIRLGQRLTQRFRSRRRDAQHCRSRQ